MVYNRVETIQLVVPAGTPTSAPVSALLFGERARVAGIEVLVPPGPSGLVGFAFWHSSEQVIPKVGGTWIIADDEVVRLAVDDLSPWPDWRIKAYNTDVYAHTLFVRTLMDDRVPADTAPLVLLPIE